MNHMDENAQFTVLENKTIGRNISLYRKIREMKALEVADLLGMKEATYTRYERGEASITIDFIELIFEFGCLGLFLKCVYTQKAK